MNNNEPSELDNDLEERIVSIENLLELARLALTESRHELIPTALETAFEKIQYMVDDYCVKEENMYERGTCHFCGKEVGEDYYCFGCRHYVCSDCERPAHYPLMGKHVVEDHQTEKLDNPAYWICWVEGTDGGRRFRHDTLESAQTEAERLARLTGKRTHIFEWKGACQVIKPPVTWEVPI